MRRLGASAVTSAGGEASLSALGSSEMVSYIRVSAVGSPVELSDDGGGGAAGGVAS